MKAEIEIECKHPEIVKKSLEPDVEEAKKFDIRLKDEKNKLLLVIESNNISGLLAGINSYMRLIRIAIEASEV